MSVMGADAWYIAVLIYGREFKFYKIERDDQVLADLIRIEQDFWENHVLKQVMPDPDGSKLADDVIAECFKQSTAQSIHLYGFDERLKRRKELVDIIGRMETEKRQIEQELKLYLGNAETAENEKYRVSWKNIESSRIDSARLQAEHPEIYAEYSKVSAYRRFQVKAA